MAAPRGKKRVAELEAAIPSSKKKKTSQDENVLEKVLSLCTDKNSLTAGLTLFLTEVTRHGNDQLLRDYLQLHPDCSHLLAILQRDHRDETADTVLLGFLCLEPVLLFTASQPSGSSKERSIGQRLVHQLMECHTKHLHSSLTSSKPDKLTASTLRLLTAMVMQGPATAREIAAWFNFAYKPVDLLASRTDKIQRGDGRTVRECFIQFGLSFLVVGSVDVIQRILQLRGFLKTVIKQLHKDSPDSIALVLTTLLQKVVRNAVISKKAKSSFFGRRVLQQLAGLIANDSQLSSSVCDVTFELLLTLATDIKLGICYRSAALFESSGKINNFALLQLLLALGGSLSQLTIRSLVLKTITNCPDLLVPFLNTGPLTFDPKPSTKWVTSIEMLQELFTELAPVHQLVEQYGGSACSSSIDKDSILSVCLSLTTPVAVSRMQLSAGVQSSHYIVKHLTLCLLEVVLKRAVQFHHSLEAGSHFQQLFVGSLLKQLPDVQTVINHYYHITAAKQKTPKEDAKKVDKTVLTIPPEINLKNAELVESPDVMVAQSLRVLQLFQSLSPSILSQANFTAAKLLTSDVGSTGRPTNGSHDTLIPLLQLILDSPTQSSVKPSEEKRFIKALLQLLCDHTVAPTVKKVLTKHLAFSFARHRCVADEVETIVGILQRHFQSSLYSEEEGLELMDVVATALCSSRENPFEQLSELSELEEETRERMSRTALLEKNTELAQVLEGPLVLPTLPADETALSSDASLSGTVRDEAIGTECESLVLSPVYVQLIKILQRPGPVVYLVSEVVMTLLMIDHSSQLPRLLLSFLAHHAPQYSSSVWSEYLYNWIRVLRQWDGQTCDNETDLDQKEKEDVKVKTLVKRIKKCKGDSTSSVLALLHQLHTDQWSELLSLLTTAEGELPCVVIDYISLLPFLPLKNILSDENSQSTFLQSLSFSTLWLQCYHHNQEEEEVTSGKGVAGSLAHSLSHDGVRELLLSRGKEESLTHTTLLHNIRLVMGGIKLLSECFDKMADLSQQVATALKFCFNLLSIFLTTALSDTLADNPSLSKSSSAQDKSSSLPTTELLLCIDAVLECEVLRTAYKNQLCSSDTKTLDSHGTESQKKKRRRKTVALSRSDIEGQLCEGVCSVLVECLGLCPSLCEIPSCGFYFEQLLTRVRSGQLSHLAGHHSIVELSSFLPLGDGLEIAKLIVQDQTMQDSLGTYPPLDAIGQTLCSLIVSSDRKGDVLKWLGNDKSSGPFLNEFLIPFVEGNVEQQISDVSSCLADGELVALLTKAILTHDDCSQLEKILALLLHEHIVTGRCGTHASAHGLELIAEDILTRSSHHQALKYSMPLFQKTHKQLSPQNDPTRQFLQHIPINLASQLFKHCVAELNVTRALIAKNLVILYKLDKSFVSNSLVTLYSCSEQTWASEAEDGSVEEKTLYLSVLVAVLSVCNKNDKNDSALKKLMKSVWSVCTDSVLNGNSVLVERSCEVVRMFSEKLSKGTRRYCALLSSLLEHERKEEDMNKDGKRDRLLSSCHIKMMTSLSVAVAGKRPDLWLKTVQVLLKMVGKEEKDEENEKNAESETVAIQSLIQLTDSNTIQCLADHISTLDFPLEDWLSFIAQIFRNYFHSPTHLSLVVSLIKLLYPLRNSQKSLSKEAIDESDEEEDMEEDGSIPDRDVSSLVTLYKNVWSHSSFAAIMLQADDKPIKAVLVEVLVTIAERCPQVLCDSDHYCVLLGAYSATMSRTDTGLLYLISLYEKAGTSIAKFSPFVWGPAAVELYGERQKQSWLLWQQPSMAEILSLVDRGRMKSSMSWFPSNRSLEPVTPYQTTLLDRGDEKYDPSFFLPLFSHLLDSSCVVDCLRFIEHGCFTFLLASITSEQEDMRRAGYHCLSQFLSHLEAARLREKSQLVLLVDVLKNTIHKDMMRLPTVFAAFIARAALLFFHPEHDIFPVVAYAVVHKPFLELRDIPLYSTLIHSSSTTHGHQERQWLLELLLDGLRDSSDYPRYRKKGVFPHLMLLYGSLFADKKTKTLILRLMLRACAMPSPAVDLVWSHGLFPWLQAIVGSLPAGHHDGPLLVKVITVLWKTLQECAESREKELDLTSSAGVLLPKIPMLEEDIVLGVSHLVELINSSHRHKPISV